MFLFRFVFAVVWHTVEAVPDIPSHRIGIQLTICDDGIAFRWKADGGLPATLDDLDGSGLGIQMADGFACAISDDFFSDHFIHLACFWYVCEDSQLIEGRGVLRGHQGSHKKATCASCGCHGIRGKKEAPSQKSVSVPDLA